MTVPACGVSAGPVALYGIRPETAAKRASGEPASDRHRHSCITFNTELPFPESISSVDFAIFGRLCCIVFPKAISSISTLIRPVRPHDALTRLRPRFSFFRRLRPRFSFSVASAAFFFSWRLRPRSSLLMASAAFFPFGDSGCAFLSRTSAAPLSHSAASATCALRAFSTPPTA